MSEVSLKVAEMLLSTESIAAGDLQEEVAAILSLKSASMEKLNEIVRSVESTICLASRIAKCGDN